MTTSSSARAQLRERLQSTPFFRGVDTALLDQMAHNAVRRDYRPGAVIFLEGDVVPVLFYVATGWVKVVKMSPDGREQILQLLGPGEFFGGMGVFAVRPALATAIALEETEIWLLLRDALQQILAANPTLALQVIELMADRISELITLVADLSLHTVMARLARLLLEQATNDVVQRRRWATRAEMAARLGAVPDVLNRALRMLVEEGLIELDRRQIRILDRDGLAAKAAPNR
jgi:CRP/FNR family transcriptional regulator, dissimilatory nitrate respiration regulator